MALHNDVFEQVWDWLCNDIESCFKVSQDLQNHLDKSQFKGGLNFPAALTMFSVIELAVGYYSGGDPNSDSAADFVSKYLGKYSPSLLDRSVAKKWYEVLRHGLAHQWSPKAGGVAMDFHYKGLDVFAWDGMAARPSHP